MQAPIAPERIDTDRIDADALGADPVAAQPPRASSVQSESVDTQGDSRAWIASLAAIAGDDRWLAAELVARGAQIGQQVTAEGDVGSRAKTSVSDVVTIADHRAEADILAALTTLRPDDGVLGEEGAARPSRTGRTWIVDPIDGTYNYAHRISAWCSAIALCDDARQPLLGAIRSGVRPHTWVGVPAAGELTLDGIPQPALTATHLGAVSVATYLHPARMSDVDCVRPWLAAVQGAATIRMLGSGSLDLVDVATGRVGAFLQSGTADWDWCPGLALVTAAGGIGRIVHHRGQRWHIAGSAPVVEELAERLLGA